MLQIAYGLLKPLLFSLDPESAHIFTLELANKVLNHVTASKHRRSDKHIYACGIKVSSPVGIAAGFDKYGRYIKVWEYLEAGFVELGGITPRPQQGHQTPRIARIKSLYALVNWMGLNNPGVEAARRNIIEGRQKAPDIVVGANIAMNADTPLEKAPQDYSKCVFRLRDCVDFFVINVSSPNTGSLRKLVRNSELLLSIIDSVRMLTEKPLWLKIALDISDPELENVLKVCEDFSIEGLVCFNTWHEGVHKWGYYLRKSVPPQGMGGLSGFPNFALAISKLQKITQIKPRKTGLIFSGGIMSEWQAMCARRAGADLLEVFTGLIYRGPQLISQISD